MEPAKKKADALVEGSDYLLSLNKLLGKKVVDIQGHLSNEFGQVTFQMYKIVLDDGTMFFAEGEHDFPYLTDGDAKFDEDQFKAIYAEDNDDEES